MLYKYDMIYYKKYNICAHLSHVRAYMNLINALLISKFLHLLKGFPQSFSNVLASMPTCISFKRKFRRKERGRKGYRESVNIHVDRGRKRVTGK